MSQHLSSESLNTYFGINLPRLTLKTYSTSLCSTWGSKSLESLTISLALNMQLNFIFICHKKRYIEITIISDCAKLTMMVKLSYLMMQITCRFLNLLHVHLHPRTSYFKTKTHNSKYTPHQTLYAYM